MDEIQKLIDYCKKQISNIDIDLKYYYEDYEYEIGKKSAYNDMVEQLTEILENRP